jgi:pyruvate/2-oxoglutarate dehydrogenase complex dihydrolipoamide dehydrogenase (E3) component
METFDAIVIGAGQSGPFLAAKLAGAGRKVALIERRRLGGTCVNDGCIPTKALIASARAAWVARSAARWGVRVAGDVTVDMQAVKARKDGIVQESRTSLQSWLGNLPGLTLIDGHARFVSPHRVDVGGRTLEGRELFLNTGARATMPLIEGIADIQPWTNTDMMAVDTLPPHLLVLGGSYVGLEFAQMYRRFGSRVTVLQRGPRIVPREDPDVSDAMSAALRDEGVEILTDVDVRAFARAGAGVRVSFGDRSIDGSHLLVAVGRTPNSDDLGLDLAAVKKDPRGYIEVDDRLRTSQPHIYALGDVNGRGAFTHTSYNDFEIVEANLLRGGDRKVSDRIPIYALYVDPPLGRVGMNEAQARATGRRVLRGLRPMTRVGRAFERSETVGFLKILVDADTQAILGATLLGIEADEVIHSIADVMYAKAPYTVIRDAVHAHPTVSELIPTVLESLSPLPPA